MGSNGIQSNKENTKSINMVLCSELMVKDMYFRMVGRYLVWLHAY